MITKKIQFPKIAANLKSLQNAFRQTFIYLQKPLKVNKTISKFRRKKILLQPIIKLWLIKKPSF